MHDVKLFEGACGGNMSNVISFIIGLSAGATFGAVVVALMVEAGRESRMEEEELREHDSSIQD